MFPLRGDISLPELGLSDDDRNLLERTVNVVFHAAATIRFNEPLGVAVNMNVRGTDQTINLCSNMTNLLSFVHVSTAYSNADLRDIREIVYR